MRQKNESKFLFCMKYEGSGALVPIKEAYPPLHILSGLTPKEP